MQALHAAATEWTLCAGAQDPRLSSYEVEDTLQPDSPAQLLPALPHTAAGNLPATFAQLPQCAGTQDPRPRPDSEEVEDTPQPDSPTLLPDLPHSAHLPDAQPLLPDTQARICCLA